MRRLRFKCLHFFKRAGAVFALACLLPLAVAAYTVQMRGGRRIEIPDQFFVTQTTLTYEAAPTISVTLQLMQIDIAATEQLNGEAPGSLLKRAIENERERAALQSAAEIGTQRTLTNSDLDSAKQTRLESEKAYERRRQELKLPPVEETARRAQAEAAALREATRNFEGEQAEAENYWRARASALRAEIAALDGEIEYLHARLGESPDRSVVGLTSGFLIIQQPAHGGIPRYPARSWPDTHRPSIYSGRTGTQQSANLNINGATRGGVFLQREDSRRTLRRRAFPNTGVFFPNFFAFSIPFNYVSATRELLLERLYTLESVRAGFDERWRLLEDEARRAGALPGWLRP